MASDVPDWFGAQPAQAVISPVDAQQSHTPVQGSGVNKYTLYTVPANTIFTLQQYLIDMKNGNSTNTSAWIEIQDGSGNVLSTVDKVYPAANQEVVLKGSPSKQVAAGYVVVGAVDVTTALVAVTVTHSISGISTPVSALPPA